MRMLIIAIALITLISGCSQPVVIYNNRIYAGFFEHENISYEGGEYNKLKGVGISIGLLAFGMGYYNLQYLIVNKQVAAAIESPIASVLIGYEKDPFNFIFIRSGK